MTRPEPNGYPLLRVVERADMSPSPSPLDVACLHQTQLVARFGPGSSVSHEELERARMAVGYAAGLLVAGQSEEGSPIKKILAGFDRVINDADMNDHIRDTAADLRESYKLLNDEQRRSG